VAGSDQTKTEVPRTKIDRHAVADFAAWAHALHVTEQELTDAVHKVGDDARDVIAYLLTRTTSRPHSTRRTTRRR